MPPGVTGPTGPTGPAGSNQISCIHNTANDTSVCANNDKTVTMVSNNTTAFLLGSSNTNTYVGYQTGGTKTGTTNTVIGYYAMLNGLTGSGNVAVGYNSGISVQTASNNVIIGKNSNVGSESVNSVAVGYGALANGNSNAVAIGANSIALADGSVAIGNGIIATNENGLFVKHNLATTPPTLTSGTLAGFKNSTNELVEYPMGNDDSVMTMVSGIPTWQSVSVPYVPAPSQWASSPPTNLTAAVDRLISAFVALHGPIP